jgi:serine protease
VFTWTFTFLDAYLRDSATARARLQRMASVIGGYPEARVLDYTAPASPTAEERIVVEYYNAALDHYFLTAEPAEAAMLDEGVIVPGWKRTGYDFKAWALGAAPGLSACRFFGTPGLGPNSHFYTIDANECAIVKANPGWTFEGLAFQADAPLVGDCPADRMLVTRLYNDGKGGQANHRYLTSRSVLADMLGQGWIVEGPVYCTPP